MYDLHKILCVGVYLWPKNSSPTGDYVFIEKDTASPSCYSQVGKQDIPAHILINVPIIANLLQKLTQLKICLPNSQIPPHCMA